MPSEQEISGRTPEGRFAPGASGNPGGRPRSASRYRALFAQQVTEECFVRIVDKIITAAEAGDLQAQKLVLEYVIGKPLASDPEQAAPAGSSADLLAVLLANVRAKREATHANA